jgi:hypothetical protein
VLHPTEQVESSVVRGDGLRALRIVAAHGEHERGQGGEPPSDMLERRRRHDKDVPSRRRKPRWNRDVRDSDRVVGGIEQLARECDCIAPSSGLVALALP